MLNFSRLLTTACWCMLTTSAFAISSRPTTIAYLDTATHEHIYSFASGNNGHLVVNYWDGFAWQWADLGLPAGATAVYSPNAITYVDSAQHQHIYVFAEGSNGHLVVKYWDGFAWHDWADLGLPAGATAVYSPNAITYVDSGEHQRIYVFAEGSNGHLVVKYWDGFAWQWGDLSLPAGATAVHSPNAITYVGSAGNRLIYVFAEDSNGHLVVRYWDGFAWYWADQGLPAGVTAISNPNAVTYADSAGNHHIYVFAGGSNGHLVVNYWDGSWHWGDQGLPAGASWVAAPSAITYLDASKHQRLYIFAEGSNGHLVANYWSGSHWYWADQGLPVGASSVFYPDAITLNQQIYVFAEASSNHLVVDYWDLLSWHWADQGTL